MRPVKKGLTIGVLCGAAALAVAASWTAGSSARVQVVVDADQAEAVLEILGRRPSGAPATEADWRRLFESAGYRRLSEREAAMKRAFTREDFEAFVRSPELSARADALAETLEAWKRADVSAAASRALAYLPPQARIRATIYPVIKPKPNSFVFDVEKDPAIFLALDPAVSPGQFANTLAHELHHIGFGTACPMSGEKDVLERLPKEVPLATKWLGAFGEGFAMLAAAGGPDVHPHQESPNEDRQRWDRDIGNFDSDFSRLDRFFHDVIGGRLNEKEADEQGFSFFGVQGPWYTVGYRMAVTIDRAFGREKLIRAFCDVRRLPATYNRAAERLGLRGARWSRDLIEALKRPKD
jgi:hypothetical protein